MSWDVNTEKLLCHMVLDDVFADEHMLAGPEGTFWRAFIVQDRQTGKTFAKFRYHHVRGDKNWYTVAPPDEQNEHTVNFLRCSLEDGLVKALLLLGASREESMAAIHCYYPPDDEGHPERTIDWLLSLDLIEVRSVALERPDGITYDGEIAIDGKD